MSMISNIRRTIKKVIYTDCEWLRSYEVEALVTFYLHLNDIDKCKLIYQFKRLDMLDRSPNGKLTQFFDGLDTIRKDWPEEIRINADMPIEGYQFVIKNSNKIYTRFVLFLGKGGLGEVQFTKMPATFSEKVCKVTQIAEVLLNLPKLSENKTSIFEKIISEEEVIQLDDDLNRSL